MPYEARKPSNSEYLMVRGVRYHVRRWGRPDAPKLVLLHGWRDTSITWQFVIDLFKHDWNIIAPDWAGFGLSGLRTGTYNYGDYLADLDCILDHYSPEAPVPIIAHSMGGNTTGIYAGMRPHRVSQYATLEGFGPTPPYGDDKDVKRLRIWLDGVREGREPSRFGSRAEVTQRLMRSNHRLCADKAAFLADHSALIADDGRLEIAGDPAHQRFIGQVRVGAGFYHVCWRNFPGKVLWMAANESDIMRAYYTISGAIDSYGLALAQFRDVSEVVIENAGHNMHHDQPERVARALESFFVGQDTTSHAIHFE